MECVTKYKDSQVWQYFTDLFDYFITAVLIDSTYLCLHGGLSPSLSTITDIQNLNRFQEIPNHGALADIMWSDPDDSNSGNTASGFQLSPRGAGFLFGEDVLDAFLKRN